MSAVCGGSARRSPRLHKKPVGGHSLSSRVTFCHNHEEPRCQVTVELRGVGMATTKVRVVSPSSPPCSLRAESQPLVIRGQPGAIVENVWLRISASGVAAISCIDSPGVILRRLRIEHAHDGVGIRFERCDRITIEDVAVSALVSHHRPNKCGLRFSDCDNIHGVHSADARIERVRVAGGSTGIELQRCTRARISSLIALNLLGPYPRGQCVQFSRSDEGSLDNFYCRNDPCARRGL